MTLDEAISMYTNNAEYERTHGSLQRCLDFRQLAEWLSELKTYKEHMPSYETGYNDAKRVIALSGEYERAYERGKADAQMERWILLTDKLPEEREWIGTKQFGTTKSDEVYVTFETPKGDRFTKHLSFQNGRLSASDQQMINAFHKGSVPVAWLPLPEPCKAESSDRNDLDNLDSMLKDLWNDTKVR